LRAKSKNSQISLRYNVLTVQNLNVQLNAIVNDSTATLLSKAYSDRSTRYGLILGTGVNIAFDAPVGTIGLEKFGIRPASWHQVAKSVLVNTELGMFGRDLLPLTAWDIQLNDAHVRPNFQPLEHLTGGRYLGEIARLILLEGIQTAGLFGGAVPSTMDIPYTLDTEFLANIQS
jgi:hexokinase